MMEQEIKKELYTALVNAQVELQNPAKNKKGYGYKYATLDSIIEQTKPILKKHGLCVVQTLTGDGIKVGITTAIIHTSGQSLLDTLWLPATDMKGVNVVQAIGASITYGRRYALSAILGISADDDTDAVITHKNTPNSSVGPQTGKIAQEPKETTTNANPSGTDIDIIPIGKHKGGLWTELGTKSLNNSLSYYSRLIANNPSSPYRKSNKAIIKHIEAILAARGE